MEQEIEVVVKCPECHKRIMDAVLIRRFLAGGWGVILQ